MSDHQSIIDFKQLLQSEIADFCAGIGAPGEPATPADMQRDLLKRLEDRFAEVENKWFLFPSKDFVWMTRGEFNHYMAITKMKPVNLESIKVFSLLHYENSKGAAARLLADGDVESYQFMTEDAFEWIQLARGLSREIKKLGGL